MSEHPSRVSEHPSRGPSLLGWLLRFGLSLIVGGVFVYLTVSSMTIDWEALPRQLSQVKVSHLLLFSLGFFGVHLLRIWRWFYLVRPLGQARFGPVFHAGAIGFAAIMLLPFRLGELVRPYALSRRGAVSMSEALSTAVVERVIDGLAITMLLFIALTTQATRPEATAAALTAGSIAGAVFGTTLVVLLLCWWQRAWTIRALRRVGQLVSGRLTEKLLGVLEGFLDGMRTLRSGGDLYRFLALTVLYWGLNGATMAYLAQAFGFDLGVWQAMALLSMLVLGIMIPGPPSHVGTFHYALTVGLGLFIAVDQHQTQVAAFIITIHLLQLVIQIGSGVPSWLMQGFSLRRALKDTSEPSAEAC